MVNKRKTDKKPPKGTIITRVIFRPKNENPTPKIPSTRRLVRESFGFMARYRKLFIPLGLIYLVASWLLVALPLASQYASTKELLDTMLEEGLSGATGITTLLLGGIAGEYTAPQSESGQILASLFMLLFALAIIFSVRHLVAHENDAKVAVPGVRDVLYSSPAPLIAVVFTMLLLVVAMLPAALGIFLITFVFGMEAPWWQQIFPTVSGVALVVLSLFWLIRFIFALFVVTLPGARPIEAIRETKNFVPGRRWSILWRLLFVGIILALAWMVLFVPFLLLDLWIDISWLPIVPMAIGAINALLLTAGTIFMYKLYRSLL
jgi:hypothetical protein